MDLASLTLVGLVAFGVVNVVSFFKPDLDSRVKFAISAVAAFVVTFIPVEVGNVVLQNVKLALEAAFSASAVYKVATRVGGN